MGALIGGAYASGKLDAVKTWALSADRRVVSSMVDVSLLAGGLLDGVRIMNWLGLMGLTDSIEDLEVPFGAVATDLTTG